MKAKFKITWDYAEGIINHSSTFWFQKDWNQTLITRINQMSATIFQRTLYGGANEIVIHPKLFPLIETLEYYRDSTKMISGKYHVTIDENQEEDKIIVRRKDFPIDPIISKGFDKNLVTILSSSPKIEEYKNMQDDIELRVIEPEDMVAEITILNYT